MIYTYSLVLAVSAPKAFSFFSDLERWFRLNPQWDVESFGKYDFRPESIFTVAVKYERNEMQVSYQGRITKLNDGENLSLALEGTPARKFSITLQQEGDRTRLLYCEESESELSNADKLEINLWLRSVANYLTVTSRNTLRGHAWKFFVDRIWLKMSLFGRRITIFILLGEAFSLALFVLFLLWHYYFRI